MSKLVDKLLTTLDEFERDDPSSRGLAFRLDLAEIVGRELRAKGWTQRKLAEVASVKEPFISRILHSEANCTFDTAGRLLFALGVQGTLVSEESRVERNLYLVTMTGERRGIETYTEKTNGEASIKEECQTAQA